MATQPPSHTTNELTIPRKSAEDDEFVLDEQQRILQLLRPIDDEFMRCLFRGQLPLAQQILRTITGIDDLVLTEEVTQYDLKRLAGSRSVCLDVLGTDTAGTKHDLEVQRADKGAEPKRARYNSSALDVETLKAGQDFAELPESYIIFVTENDTVGDGQPLHHFRRIDPKTHASLGDGSHIIYASAAYDGNDELGRLMHDFLCSDPDEMLTPEMAERTRYLKTTPKGETQMSRIVEEYAERLAERRIERHREEMEAEARRKAEEYVREMREEAVREAREEAVREAREEAVREAREEVAAEMREVRETHRKSFIDSIASLMRTMNLTAKQAMDALSIPAEDQACYLEALQGRAQ